MPIKEPKVPGKATKTRKVPAPYAIISVKVKHLCQKSTNSYTSPTDAMACWKYIVEGISLHQNWRPMSWADMGGHRQL